MRNLFSKLEQNFPKILNPRYTFKPFVAFSVTAGVFALFYYGRKMYFEMLLEEGLKSKLIFQDPMSGAITGNFWFTTILNNQSLSSIIIGFACANLANFVSNERNLFWNAATSNKLFGDFEHVVKKIYSGPYIKSSSRFLAAFTDTFLDISYFAFGALLTSRVAGVMPQTLKPLIYVGAVASSAIFYPISKYINPIFVVVSASSDDLRKIISKCAKIFTERY